MTQSDRQFLRSLANQLGEVAERLLPASRATVGTKPITKQEAAAVLFTASKNIKDQFGLRVA